MNLLSILTAVAVMGASVLALEGVNLASGGEFYLASVQHLAEESAQSAAATAETAPAPSAMPVETQPPPQPLPAEKHVEPTQQGQFQPPEFDEGQREEFIDPREISDGLRNINQFRGEAKRTLKQIKKQATPADIEEISRILAEVDKLYSIASNSSNLNDARDAIREFHEGQYWDSINKIRSRLEIPKQIKDITQSIRRLEKIAQAKATKNIGLDLGKLAAALAEMKQNIATVQSHYGSGNYEEAQEEMQYFHEGGHPGEIEGVIFRLRDIKNMAKRVKDAAVHAEIDAVLQEVVDAFNAGEYRDARETLDEYADDLQQLISQLVRAQSRRGFSRKESSSRVQSLGDLIARKLQEADNRQERVAQPQAVPGQ